MTVLDLIPSLSVTLNKTIRGKVATITKTIVGKTSAPQNIFNFTGGQNTDQITLLWSYPRAASGDLADLDLKEVIIRRAPGTVTGTVENFVAADPLVSVSAGTARKSIPIDTFGTFTYLARTRDTSGNFSDDVQKITFTITRPQRSTVVQAFNEDSPAVNLQILQTQTKARPTSHLLPTQQVAVERVPGGTATDNANGTSSGFSAIGGAATIF